VQITPLPGVRGADVLEALQNALMQLHNARSAGHSPDESIDAYVRWASEAARQLRHRIRPDDVALLILTRGYHSLLTLAATSAVVTNATLELEIDDRLAELDTVQRLLQVEVARWAPGRVLVVLDTNVYLHEQKIETLDLAAILQVREDCIHVLVPMVVVDELDRLKQHSKDAIRWRAGYTLSFLDRHLNGSSLQGRIRDEDFSALSQGGIPRGEISAEVVLDPKRHRRLPIADDEIVDRAIAIQGIAGQTVHLVTFDTGMAMRARAAGLTVHKRDMPTKMTNQPDS